MRTLQEILDAISYDRLPPAWTTVDLTTFSQAKRMWDYQQEALQNALKGLETYYQDLVPYRPGETKDVDEERKRRFWQWYHDNGLTADLDLSLRNAKRDLVHLLADYYPTVDDRISYEQLVNRLGFWMATGSGKTLVLVKLLELLWSLSRLGEIPAHDILVLTCREDLLQQLHEHVAEFNAARGDLYINLRDLRDYPEVKRGMPSLFHAHELTVFYYRSDNLSDEQKEKIIDFRNYDNDGRWYILLDEAHKGDKEDSKRQHIYNLMARRGFLFNFSATFTDPRDVATTAYDFNLARFIESGYGKHLALLQQENRAFRERDDFTGEEKQKVVLKSLMLLAAARQAYDGLLASGAPPMYHRPLLVALVNSVNKQDADLKLFFRELERIGKGKVRAKVWRQAQTELLADLDTQPEYLFESARYTPDRALFENLTPADLLRTVFNAPKAGDVEVYKRPSNRQELAFQLKSADQPFALIKIGDITGWLKEELTGYEINEGFEDEGYFERLNAGDSDINILLGSRTFYEGWDSNRPNVMTFINIGVGPEARKFVLQAIGRGVRIEPVKNRRRRLQVLNTAHEISYELFRQAKPYAPSLETLFILGTNRPALETILGTLGEIQGQAKTQELALEVNRQALDDHILLIPQYRSADHPLIDQREPAKFPLAAPEVELFRRYVDYLGDDRLLLARHNLSPHAIGVLHRSLAEPERYYRVTDDARRFGNVNLLIPRLVAHLALIPEELERLKPLEDEIRHFRHIQVALRDLTELQGQIERVKNFPRRLKELRERFNQLSFEEYEQRRQAIAPAAQYTHDGQTIDITYIANHYYIPLILSADDKIEYIRHIIREPSEVKFVRQLEAYLTQPDHRFKQFDWWLFSKLDETLDEVYLPYYDPDANRIRRFYPDFIFWLQKGDDYVILFVDPKGMKQTGYQYKIDGYEALFKELGQVKSFTPDGVRVRVLLAMFTDDANLAPAPYRQYWFDTPASLLAKAFP